VILKITGTFDRKGGSETKGMVSSIIIQQVLHAGKQERVTGENKLAFIALNFSLSQTQAIIPKLATQRCKKETYRN